MLGELDKEKLYKPLLLSI